MRNKLSNNEFKRLLDQRSPETGAHHPAVLNECQEYFYERFERDPESECWNWTGELNTSGYPHLSKTTRVYRVAGTRNGHVASALVFVHDAAPRPEGMVFAHQCDNKRCVNPDHLFPTTQRLNVLDAQLKGRRGDLRPSEWRPEGIRKITVTTLEVEPDE